LSKADLLPYLPFSVEAAIKDAQDVNPNLETLTISSTSGEGLDAWCDWVMDRVAAKKAMSTKTTVLA
jgi:hydrogenase nickel incorporation protein HypB